MYRKLRNSIAKSLELLQLPRDTLFNKIYVAAFLFFYSGG